MLKDTGGSPGEDIHRARPGRVPSSRASVPWSWDASLSWHVDVFPNPSLQIPYFWDFTEASARRYD